MHKGSESVPPPCTVSAPLVPFAMKRMPTDAVAVSSMVSWPGPPKPTFTLPVPCHVVLAPVRVIDAGLFGAPPISMPTSPTIESERAIFQQSRRGSGTIAHRGVPRLLSGPEPAKLSDPPFSVKPPAFTVSNDKSDVAATERERPRAGLRKHVIVAGQTTT